jgi:hypothetical protein
MRTTILASTVIVAVVAVVAPAPPAAACTTAVISGAATPDGRPLLWKNRDTDDRHNQVVYRDDGRYPYLGVVNQRDAVGLEIWAGVNAEGFAIMNSASYNLDEGDTEDEGRFMKVALQSCRTVGEFQALLEATNEPGRSTTANFGVIDAHGGAATFETGLHDFKRFDATDPAVAPQGWIVRTNYSEGGDAKLGSGLIRAERARALVGALAASGRLTASTLLTEVARDVANARIGQFPGRPGAAEWAYTGDSINRDITASVVLFAGVKPGEDPRLATMWVILGQPVTGAAVPLWVAAAAVPAELAVRKDPAPLNAACDRVRGLLVPTWRGDLKRYLHVPTLVDPQRGVLAALLPREAANFAAATAAVERWRAARPSPADVLAFEGELAKATLDTIERFLAAQTPPPAATP